MSNQGVILSIGNTQFGGWENISINLGIKQMAGEFSLTASDKWPGSWGNQRIQRGDACTVAIDGEIIITGWVDDINPHYDAHYHSIAIGGRDKMGDLVDCSAIHKSGHWMGATLLQIANDLCSPFGIQAVALADVGPAFKDFAIQEGETIFEAINRAAAQRGLLAFSDGTATLLLGRAGILQSAAVLQNPGNILAAEGRFSFRDRFSSYIVKGQRRGTDEDVGTPDLIASQSGSVVDDGITRYRPIAIIAEEQGTAATFQQRAAWERNKRLGASIAAHIVVAGWRQQGRTGKLWAINTLVKVVDPWLWLNDMLLIAGICFQRGETGTTTSLELTHPAAFDLLPEGLQETARKSIGIEAKS